MTKSAVVHKYVIVGFNELGEPMEEKPYNLPDGVEFSEDEALAEHEYLLRVARKTFSTYKASGWYRNDNDPYSITKRYM